MMPGFRDLNLRVNYGLGHNLLTEFYIPVLSRAVSYDRAVAYFNSHGLAGAAAGLARFIQGGGVIRLMVSPHNWDPDDIQAIKGAVHVPENLARRLAKSLLPDNEIQAQRLSVLAWLVQEGRLEARVLIGAEYNLYHQKIGILRDTHGDGVAFSGSNNETVSGWKRNAEIMRVDCSWKDVSQHESFHYHAQEFEQLWNSQHGFTAMPFPEALVQELLRWAPDSPPVHVDLPDPDPISAPSVTFFPHQEEGVACLVDAYPQSRLLADEVGLGKTITAGGALLHLLEAGTCTRALILAPANVCVQWQEELAQKFGHTCPRLGSGRIHFPDGSHEPVPANPFDRYDLLIASSHLVRLPAWRKQLAAAKAYDLAILDEAHHARRPAPESNLKQDRQRFNLMLQLLNKILRDSARCLWLLTATPIQLHLVEFFDLLHPLMPQQEPKTSPLQHWDAFKSFYRACISPSAQQDWDILGKGVRSLDCQIGEDIRRRLKPADRKRLQSFGQPGRDASADARNLCQSGHRELLLDSIRARSPGNRFMLRRTRQQMGMATHFAKRIPRKVEIAFASAEAEDLYRELDDFLLRLLTRKGKTPRGFGFMLATYRKRLTSSWQAVSLTIERALQRQKMPVDEIELMEQGLDPSESEHATISDKAYAGFTDSDWSELQAFSARVRQMADSQDDPKIQQLHRDIDNCRARGVSMLLFTQFVDTLDYVRTRLQGAYQDQVACYSGAGGEIWQGDCWRSVSKECLTQAFAQSRIAILLCTDAASEGLNLQTASTLINYDLPWNPMRVEQRIGRMDRINQQAKTLDILNYVMRNTIEDRVYEVLGQRIGIFESTVGNTQPILGRIENTLLTSSRDRATSRLEALCEEYRKEGEQISVVLG